jgi:flagellar biosynthesis/type III secretory pathway chaperone
MENVTARVSDSINVSSLRRGFDSLCIELNREEDVLPPNEIASSYRSRLEELTKARSILWGVLGRPKKAFIKRRKKEGITSDYKHPKALQLFFDIGDKQQEIGLSLKAINEKTREGQKLNFSCIFMGVAREMLDEKTLNSILDKSRELEQTGFKGTNAEWVEFVSTLD